MRGSLSFGLLLLAANCGSSGGPASDSGATSGGSTAVAGGPSGNAGTGALSGAGTSAAGTAGVGQGGAPAGGTSASGGTAASGGAAGFAAGGAAGLPGYIPPAAGRTSTALVTGWRFLRADATGASASAFNDSAWTAVSVPHTWNNLDGQDGGNNYYRGIGWYRTHYALPADAAKKSVYLEFDGANTVSTVYVNGTRIGEHRGGFARFRFDVTAAMLPGADNVIAVSVSNAALTDVAPLNADFTFFGGLYRAVHVLVTDALHIDAEDHGASGVYLDATNVSAASAALRVRTKVRNNRTTAENVTATTVVVGRDGRVVTTLSASALVPAASSAELSTSAAFVNPHLWAGRADPYVYTTYTELRTGSQSVDWVAEPLGFRSFAVSPSGGFSLNGRALDLHGVNRHQDRLNLGWAISDLEHDEDMDLIQELGATAIRLAHYQHAAHFYDLADRAGLVIWAEIPLVNAITNSTPFSDNAKQQLTELIRQNYNHPAIVFWSIGNEQRADDAATNTLLTSLNTLVHSEDPNRISTYAHCCTSDTTGLPTHADVVGYNEYFGWYSGTYNDFAGWLDNLHSALPARSIALSEYGAGAGLTQHAENPAPPDPYGLFHPEEYQALFHEAYWGVLATRPFVWGKFIWNMFDFAVDSRNEGDTPGRNDKGLVSYDRKTRKDAFYWYKANWTTDPFVYITSRRFTPRTIATTAVKVYSNASSVELRVNGTSLGSKTSANHIFSFANAALSSGANVVEALGTAGTSSVTDSVTWTR